MYITRSNDTRFETLEMRQGGEFILPYLRRGALICHVSLAVPIVVTFFLLARLPLPSGVLFSWRIPRQSSPVVAEKAPALAISCALCVWPSSHSIASAERPGMYSVGSYHVDRHWTYPERPPSTYDREKRLLYHSLHTLADMFHMRAVQPSTSSSILLPEKKKKKRKTKKRTLFIPFVPPPAPPPPSPYHTPDDPLPHETQPLAPQPPPAAAHGWGEREERGGEMASRLALSKR